MQKVTQYLANNKVVVIANLDGLITEYRQVYQRHINLYKGIDNTIHFEVKDHDQKALDITSYTPKFVAYDENKSLVLEKDGTVLDDTVSKTTTVAETNPDDTLEFSIVSGISIGMEVTGTNILGGTLVKFVDTVNNLVTLNKKSSAVVPLGTSITFRTRTKKGVFTISVAENDLLDIKQQYLSYNIFLVDSTNTKTLTYTNAHFDANGIIYVSDKAFPGPSTTYSVSAFDKFGETWFTEAVDAQPSINGNSALHTAAIYSSDYSGEITIQGTLENQITQNTFWSNVDTVTIANATQPVPVNFNGVYNYIRFVADTDPTSKISQILVRN